MWTRMKHKKGVHTKRSSQKRSAIRYKHNYCQRCGSIYSACSKEKVRDYLYKLNVFKSGGFAEIHSGVHKGLADVILFGWILGGVLKD